eukprot:6356194-Alexandrium_andersonii.AAC.1
MGICERHGWPPDLMVWRQTRIPKEATDVPKTEKLRPIAIAAVAVQAWNRHRAAQISRWIAPAMP